MAAPEVSTPPVLQWRGVSYRVRSGRWVLQNVSGCARAGRLLAVMGPSGCGKSTLLCALASRLPAQPGARLGGELRSPRASALAFVPQDPSFFAHLTVRETLALAAKLRGPDAAAEAAVEESVRSLGLADAQGTLVGGESGGRAVAGVSGGERRRLAIGCETVCAPPARGRCLFTDEPTSGLDSAHAARVLAALKALAAEGLAVVAALHQPRSSSFNLLDDLLLLAPGGRVAYFGPRSEALRWFEGPECGLGACPPRTNPAEWLIDAVSIDTTSAEAEARSRARVARLATAWEARCDVLGDGSEWQLVPAAEAAAAEESHRRGPLRAFKLLLGRAARCAARDMWVNATRAGASLVLGCAFGGLNRRLGLSQKSVPRRAALLMQAVINTAFLAMVKSLNGFPKERAVVRREVARGGAAAGGYSPVTYFLSKLLVEAPIDALFPLLFGSVAAHLAGLNPRRRGHLLGTLALQGLAASSLGLCISALAPSTEAALALGPCAMVLSIMLGDSSGAFAEVPASLRPLSDLSIVKWGFEGALCAEFAGLRFEQEPMPPAAPGRAGAAAAAAARAAADALCVRDGEAFLARLRLPASGGVRACAEAQLRAAALSLGVALVALQVRDGGGRRGSARWEAGLRAPRVGEDGLFPLKPPRRA